jgi:hypothetical protein
MAATGRGAFAGFAVPALPFIINAPTRFFDQIVVAQTGRQGSETWSLPISQRLAIITGSQEHWVSGAGGRAIVLASVVVVLAVAVYAGGRSYVRPFDWFAAAAALVVLGALFTAADFYLYYTYVSATAVAVLAGVVVGLFRATMAASLRGRPGTDRAAGLLSPVVVALVCILGALQMPRTVEAGRSYLSTARDSGAMIAAAIPAGACVAFDEPGPLIVADRFRAGRSCPRVVDPYGWFLILNDGRPDTRIRPFEAEFVEHWRRWLERSEYVLLAAPRSSFVPGTADLGAWFDSEFELMAFDGRAFVYRRR